MPEIHEPFMISLKVPQLGAIRNVNESSGSSPLSQREPANTARSVKFVGRERQQIDAQIIHRQHPLAHQLGRIGMKVNARSALPAEFEHEPARALHAEQDGLALVHRLLSNAAHHLTDDGVMLVEVGESAERLIAAYPTLDILWCEFEQGGDGVFAVTAQTLRAASNLWPSSEACHVG